MPKRKELMAVLDATLRQLNGWDEMDAEGNAVKRVLEMTQAELAQTQARLETSKAELMKADANHARWRGVAAKEQLEGNKAIDVLQAKRQELEQQVADAQAKFDNIIAGIRALTERLKVA
jgi:hypothetical protein